MKILLSHEHPFHKMGYGGGHQIVRGLAKRLSELGHCAHIISSGVDEIGVAVDDAPVIFHLTGSYNKYLMGFATAWLTMKLAFKLRPDWVCCFTSEALLVVPFCRIIGIKVSVYEAAPELIPFRFFNLQTIHFIRYNLELYLHYLGAKLSPQVMTISNFTSLQAVENWRIDFKKISTVGAGIDDVFFLPSDQLNVQPCKKQIRFISIGRLTLKQKPLDVLAQALKLLESPWEVWTIVGSGPDEFRLKGILNRLGLTEKVVFLGMKSSVEIKHLLKQYDIVLLPSSYESLFLTAYEAAASCKLIVTNDVADIKKYFSNSPSVILADTVSSAAYLSSIEKAIKLIGDKNLKFEETASRINFDFSWDEITHRFLNVLEEGYGK